MSDISKRKQQHIELALSEDSQNKIDLFSNYLLPYRALPEINLSDVDTSIRLLGKKIRQPLIISSMTGGTKYGKTINSNLAIACEEMQVAFGVGSQRIALEIDDAKETFSIARKLAPTTVIFANMGAVQLNYGYTVDDYRKIIDLVKADALYLHLNPLQEALQPEGDTNFSGLMEKIAFLISQISPTPVFIKEVGHGLDPQSAKLLIEAGAAGIDVAGVGGTSWAWIESQRRENKNFSEWFKDFGYPTDYLIEQISQIRPIGKFLLIASGGVRNPIMGLKAHLLGADLYAAAWPFLKAAMTDSKSVVELLKDWQKGLRIGLFAIGATNWTKATKLKLMQTK